MKRMRISTLIEKNFNLYDLGMLILSEALTKLTWEALWKTHDRSAFNDVMESLETLQKSMCNKDSEGISSNLEVFTEVKY